MTIMMYIIGSNWIHHKYLISSYTTCKAVDCNSIILARNIWILHLTTIISNYWCGTRDS